MSHVYFYTEKNKIYLIFKIGEENLQDTRERLLFHKSHSKEISIYNIANVMQSLL